MELNEAIKMAELERKTNNEKELKLNQITKVNSLLESSLKEIQDEIKTKVYLFAKEQKEFKKEFNLNNDKNFQICSNKNAITLECPSLDKLLNVLDTLNADQDICSGKFLKSRIDYLEVSLLLLCFFYFKYFFICTNKTF